MDAINNRAQRVTAAISTASARTGVDFTYLINQARIESGMNPDARAKTSSATGLYQFTRQTWLATVKASGADHGLSWAADAIARDANGRYSVANPDMRAAILDLRQQPEAASAMAAEFASDNADVLTQRLGRAPESVDLYLAHFLGAAGASRFLVAHDANPEAAAAPLMPKSAAANHNIFYRRDGSARSLGEIRSHFAAKINAPGAPQFTPNTTPARAFPLPRFAAHSPNEPRRAVALASMVAMPSRLSLDFARSTYQRLSGIGA